MTTISKLNTVLIEGQVFDAVAHVLNQVGEESVLGLVASRQYISLAVVEDGGIGTVGDQQAGLQLGNLVGIADAWLFPLSDDRVNRNAADVVV
jgi:hypothetical protein